MTLALMPAPLTPHPFRCHRCHCIIVGDHDDDVVEITRQQFDDEAALKATAAREKAAKAAAAKACAAAGKAYAANAANAYYAADAARVRLW